MTFPSNWWAEGLRFSCLGCGRCCRGEPGAIYFTSEEEQRILAHLNMDHETFCRSYVTKWWGRPSLLEKRNGECVFYCRETARCSIYPVRPEQCRTFPFWPEILASRESWNACAQHCPGMNEGPLYRPEDAERLAEKAKNWTKDSEFHQ